MAAIPGIGRIRCSHMEVPHHGLDATWFERNSLGTSLCWNPSGSFRFSGFAIPPCGVRVAMAFSGFGGTAYATGRQFHRLDSISVLLSFIMHKHTHISAIRNAQRGGGSFQNKTPVGREGWPR